MAVLESSLAKGMVFVHKRSPAERDAIVAVLEWARLEAHPVESLSDMLSQLDPTRPSCLITDLPATSNSSVGPTDGLSREDLETLVEPGESSGDSHTLVICAACLTQTGCTFRDDNIGFLKRPYTRGQLLGALQNALACDSAQQERSQERANVRQKIAALTPREHQVMDLIYEGLPNKTIAGRLSLSTRTVEASRAAVYRKLGVDSGIGLVRLLARMEYEVTPQE